MTSSSAILRASPKTTKSYTKSSKCDRGVTLRERLRNCESRDFALFYSMQNFSHQYL